MAEVTFNLSQKGSYAAAVGDLRTVLRIRSPNGDVEGRPILADQLTGFPIPPVRLIHLKILGPGSSSPTLLIRDDNAFIVGFINNLDHKFELSKHGVDPTLISGATPIGFNGSYHALLGGSSNIPSLKVGRRNIIEAVKNVGKYSHRRAAADDDDDGDIEPTMAAMGIREALAVLVVSLCEGARFPPVFNAINATWDAYAAAFLTTADVPLINNWGNLSSALLGGDKFPWPSNLIQIGIADRANGLNKIALILHKVPPRPSFFSLSYIKNLWHVLSRPSFGFTSDDA